MKFIISNSVLAAGLMLLSAASYGETTITSVPYTITAQGRYILGNDLLYSAANGNAITVKTNNVTIDLNGHILHNLTSNNGATGIFASNGANVHVRNGAIAGFYVGVHFSGFGHLVDGIRFSAITPNAVWFEVSKACVVQKLSDYRSWPCWRGIYKRNRKSCGQ